MRLVPFFSAALFLFAANASPLAAGVYADFLYAQAGIFEPYSPYNTWIIGPGVFAYGTDPHLADVSDVDFSPGINKSRNGFDFQNNGTHAVLDAFWEHYVDGKARGEAYGYMFFSFIVDVDTRYSLSGLYETVGDAAPYQYLEFYEEPYIDDPSRLYVASIKESRATPNESLIIGSPLGGDFKNIVKGDLSGVLRAGGYYTVGTLNYIHAYEDGVPTTATGSFRLTLDAIDSQPVPEPASFGFFVVGAALVALSYRRRGG